MSMDTLAELFLLTAEANKPDHLLHKVGGEYRPISTAKLADDVRRVAHTLAELGVEPGDRVALMADNGPHWPTVDFATLCLGAATVPVYPTLLPEQVAYVVRDSGARVLVVHTPEQLAGLLGRRDEIPAVEHFILIAGEPEEGPALSLRQVLERGADHDAEAFDDRARAVAADDLASLVYTSGTTGEPKGVMLTHRNFVSNIIASLSILEIRSEYTALSFLPLSHVFERTIDYCYFYKRCTIAYAESVQTVAQNFQEVRPHMFVSVPRVYEKVLAKVQENVAAGSALEQKIFHWAEEVGRASLSWRLEGDHPPGWLGLKLALADGLVFSKIKARLGGRFVFAFSGGAPLGRDVAEFFWGAGIQVYEGYGLTETSPVLAANAPGSVKLGTVGRPIPGVEIRIAEDGEIVARGPNIMKGYYGKPEATAEVLEPDGWFHTGDIGELDEDGYLAITDRKKEILVNAYGKNIAPAPIENALKSSRFVGQAVVIGDRRKYLSALLVPDFEALATWAGKQGIDGGDHRALLSEKGVQQLFADEIAAVNAKLAHYEQIQSWTLLPEEFTVEGGELTPTQKVKRRVINEKYGEVIDGLYP